MLIGLHWHQLTLTILEFLMKIPGRISSEWVQNYNCHLVVLLVDKHQYRDKNPNSDLDLVIYVSVELC